MKLQSMLILLALGTFASCTKVVTKEKEAKPNTTDHYITSTSKEEVKEVKDGEIEMRFMSRNAYKSLLDGALTSSDEPTTEKTQEDGEPSEELILDFPKDLIGRQHVLGGVITKVSDSKNEDIGGLKLTDLPPMHVKTTIMRDGDYTGLAFLGCQYDCDEMSSQELLAHIPVAGPSSDDRFVALDLSEIGSMYNLIRILDPKGEATKLKTLSAETVTMDYSEGTLVFDVLTKMVPVGTTEATPNPPITEITTRWYLKLSADFDPAFTARSPVPEVGFFKTERTKDTKITRHSLTSYTKAAKMVKYYVKNVPKEYQEHVKVSLDNWNKEFQEILGRELISYEFIPEGHENNQKIVAGDIRYNVIEWDLNNIASYGGLGPSIAHQFTGQIFSANVLLQGPKIVEMYSKWFKISETARQLIADGRQSEADAMMRKFATQIQTEESKAKSVKYEMSFGNIPMNIPSQRPDLHDPIVKGLFEIVPEGMTFETYMPGYFQEMIQHEIGHNLGLRHNFRGNLGSNESKTTGSVSRSIMEYLGRGYRYLNAIGAYDRMAIAYGYKGVKPTHADWFCTDEDQGLDAKSILVRSPECSKADATPDPFSYWEGRLMRAIDLMVQPKNTRAPVLTIAHITDEVKDVATAYAGYALSAEKTAETWTNFFNKVDRPEDKKDVKVYVLNSLTKRICSPSIAKAIATKETAEASLATEKSYQDLVKTMQDQMVKLGLLKDKETICK